MEDAVPTTESSTKIVPINKDAVHHICSGQVILDLATAVKELVENSLDSGATLIEVKLTDHGRTCVSVSDNGSGIAEEEFEGVALKHHTSKLRSFLDLTDIRTFGFRGEALSSLSSLSELSMITRHRSRDYAYKLEFDRNGSLKAKKLCARDMGTTVYVKNLFKSLPVRYKEFQRNFKKEFTKAIQVLYGYCLVCTNIRITCSNTVSGKQSTPIVVTLGAASVRDNILSVFGKKALDGLIPVKQIPPDDSVLQEYGLSSNDAEGISSNIKWECYVSSCTHFMGRSSPDRQFLYVNSRPCDPVKVTRLIGHVYHKYNAKQYPFVFLNLILERNRTDVNVTPDKRTIFLIQESLILASLKSSLIQTWEKTLGSLTATKLDETLFSFKRSASPTSHVYPITKKQQIAPGKVEQNDLEQTDGLLSNITEVIINERNIPGFGQSTKSTILRMVVNLDSIRQAIRAQRAGKVTLEDIQDQKRTNKVRFRTKIAPNLGKDAEQELRKELSTDSFDKMEIVGQFNLGFIIARYKEDLFIVDQHASDEKYRFEKLQGATKLHTQQLIVPRRLNLSSLNETILITNQPTFIDNGFTFNINEQCEPGHRVELTGIPVSGNWQFGQEDIEELIFLISEGRSEDSLDCSNGIPRPSRVRQMLASRACRGAVMVGKALNGTEMRRLLLQMGQINNPWSCPHGRPTIRHLLCLSLLHH
ncbi:mismatch repair endonuclease PMS2 isoform X1 [Athalia rosae]|uniref:mismatch repair endonuclease PMS2 isoform X1 n=2 Tax=Athalia rosae TaxID=37344 RepID=UPI00203406A8|nr:mismatch repair endonuclease PMS2 isoform X1 [Athalia rosae]